MLVSGTFSMRKAFLPPVRPSTSEVLQARQIPADSTVLLWDVTLRPAARAAVDLAARWADLADDDAERAQAAVWRLAEVRSASVPLPLKPDASFRAETA
jgi:hypothetical protein